MKAFLKVLCFGLLVSSNAFAMSPPRDRTVADLTVGIFFAPHSTPRRIDLKISESGRVSKVKTYQDGKVEIAEVATLNPVVIKNILERAANLEEKDLVDPIADQPGCMDAPSSMFRVLNAKNTLVPVEATQGCHTLTHPDYFDRHVAQLLLSLELLSN